MEIRPSNIRSTSSNRSRSRSRTRNSTANSRSTSSTRRPSLSGKRSLSSSSLNKLTITPTAIDHDNSVPSTSVILDNSLPLEFFKQDILALIKALKVSKWHKKQLSIGNLIVNRISGALTNSIYKLEYNDPSQNINLPALLLRVYGKNVDSIIDRESELNILIKLGQKKIGPKLLGIFTNGRFEQFLEGFITLNKEGIRNEVISQILGRRMKDLHYKMELDPQESAASLPMAWKLIYKWLNIFKEDYLPGYIEEGIEQEDLFLVNFSKFEQTINQYKNWLFEKYDEDTFCLNYKFCHNDTQYGNLLLHESFKPSDIVMETDTEDEVNQVMKSTSNKKDSSLAVIDFEYSGANFPAFDLVNHFSEWMADYHDDKMPFYIHEDKYPNQLEVLNLLKSYVEYDFQYPSSGLRTRTFHDINQTSAKDLIQFEIRKIYNECILWRASVQIYWCLWGLIQNGPVKHSSNNFASTSEQGVDGTYNIVTALENLQVDGITVEEAITSSDDEFDYLQYSKQKAGCIMADLIDLHVIEKSDIDEKYWHLLKHLDCKLFDI